MNVYVSLFTLEGSVSSVGAFRCTNNIFPFSKRFLMGEKVFSGSRANHAAAFLRSVPLSVCQWKTGYVNCGE